MQEEKRSEKSGPTDNNSVFVCAIMLTNDKRAKKFNDEFYSFILSFSPTASTAIQTCKAQASDAEGPSIRGCNNCDWLMDGIGNGVNGIKNVKKNKKQLLNFLLWFHYARLL